MFSNKSFLALATLGVAFLPIQVKAQSLPAHTVLAFNLKTCPKGWTAYAPAEGAFVVGVGGTFSLGAGGAASMDKWVLTPAELPSFSASGLYGNVPFSEDAASPTNPRAFTISSNGPQVTPTNVVVNGGTTPPQPIPPPKYAGLKFCEKQ
jgi:hypothetical protein